MEELKSRNEYLKASNASGTAILEATASWCSQCKAIAPFVEKLIKQFPDARFYKYDTDTALDIAQELGANQMPTFTIFKDGDLMDSVTGAKGAALEKAIRAAYDGKVEEVEG
jgi:thioredoxin 1